MGKIRENYCHHPRRRKKRGYKNQGKHKLNSIKRKQEKDEIKLGQKAILLCKNGSIKDSSFHFLELEITAIETECQEDHIEVPPVDKSAVRPIILPENLEQLKCEKKSVVPGKKQGLIRHLLQEVLYFLRKMRGMRYDHKRIQSRQ